MAMLLPATRRCSNYDQGICLFQRQKKTLVFLFIIVPRNKRFHVTFVAQMVNQQKLSGLLSMTYSKARYNFRRNTLRFGYSYPMFALVIDFGIRTHCTFLALFGPGKENIAFHLRF
jgi:hypothetical protein